MDYRSKKRIVGINRNFSKRFGRLIAYSLKRYNYENISNIYHSDIIMVGYPKSGNTWMQNLLAGIMYGIDGRYSPDKLVQELIPDLDYKVIYKRISDKMLFKTHDLPKSTYNNIIYLVRDPRDVMASYYAMVSGQGVDTTASKMIINEDQLLFGNWWDHTRYCRNIMQDHNVLLVRYEDLITNTKEQLRRILKFIKEERSEELLELVVNGNSLSNMKKKQTRFGYDKKFIESEKWNQGASFIRTGKVGSSKKELPTELLSYIIKNSEKHMIAFGYE